MNVTKKYTPKERLAIQRTRMVEQDPQARAGNFKEVNLGLAEQAAVEEANRCLMCKNRPCVEGCPVAVRIPEFLERVAAGDFAAAAEILRADNALPATTGRVCPQEKQCEQVCLRGKGKGQPVAVGWLERACTLAPSDANALLSSARAAMALGQAREAADRARSAS